jgi:hypothetical protein
VRLYAGHLSLPRNELEDEKQLGACHPYHTLLFLQVVSSVLRIIHNGHTSPVTKPPVHR